MEINQRDSVPDYLRPLFDDWFGEAAAPLLFRAVNLESWDICRRLLSERSQDVICKELKHVDMYGYSAVHYACWWNSAPLDVVTQIVDGSPPDFPSQRNRKGRTPLHLAAWRGRDEVVELLASKCPQSASVTDRNQKSPLSDACSRNRSKRVLQALVKADASQICHVNNHQRTPALIFFRISHGFVSAPHRTRFSNAEEQEVYASKLRVVLAAERQMMHPTSSIVLTLDDDFNLLRAAIESPSCPFQHVKRLLETLESKLSTFRAEFGKTLLHIVVEADPFQFQKFYRCDRCSKSPCGDDDAQPKKIYFNRDPDKAHWGVRCSNPNCYRRDHNRSVMFHYVQVPVVCKDLATVQFLLDRDPSLASIPDSLGRLPLQLALEAGRSWFTGIRDLVWASPSHLSQRDLQTRLFPFQLAAVVGFDEQEEEEAPRKKRKRSDDDWVVVHEENDIQTNNNSEEEDAEQLGTIFHLLHECPNLVQSAIVVQAA